MCTCTYMYIYIHVYNCACIIIVPVHELVCGTARLYNVCTCTIVSNFACYLILQLIIVIRINL